MQLVIYRLKITLCAPDHPVRHRRLRDFDAVALEFLVETVQRYGIGVFCIHDRRYQGRCRYAVCKKRCAARSAYDPVFVLCRVHSSMVLHRFFYRGVVLKTPADLIRQTLPTVLSENTGKLVFGQFVHFFSRGKILEIFCQFAARSLRACNDSILYLRLFFLFVADNLRFVECAQLTQALKTLGAAAKEMQLQFFQTFFESRCLVLRLHKKGHNLLLAQLIQFLRRVLLHAWILLTSDGLIILQSNESCHFFLQSLSS